MHFGRAVGVGAMLLMSVACGGDDDEKESAGTTTTTRVTTDQTAPTGANGVAFDADGRLWWTGFTTGVVGRIADPGAPDATSEVVAEPGPGVNPITITDDGRVFVARLNQADALYEIDPATGDVRTVLDKPGNINAFQVGPDGRLYAPRFGVDGAGSVVAIDPDTGELEIVAPGLSLDVSVRVSPEGDIYVLAGTPPGILQVDPRNGGINPLVELPTTVADNMAFAPDGSIYVTAFNRPLAWVISPDGDVTRTLTIGRP